MHSDAIGGLIVHPAAIIVATPLRLECVPKSPGSKPNNFSSEAHDFTIWLKIEQYFGGLNYYF